MDNPYAGTEWEQSWHDGHDAGLAQPIGEVTPPAVLETDQATIYAEGVLAGQQDAATGGTPVAITPVPPTEPENKGPELLATTVFALLGWAAEAGKAGLSGGIGVAVHILVSVAIPTGEPEPDLGDPVELADALRHSLQTLGAADLWLPFCQNKQHSATGDTSIEQGYWHDNVFIDYWAAYPVAEAHLKAEPDSLGLVGLLHYQAESDGFEWLELA